LFGKECIAMSRLTVTAKGQVTLRKELLRHLGVAPGQKIEAQELPGGRIEIRAARPTGDISSFIGRLAGKSKKIATLEEIGAAAASGWAGEE
jgi:antitoxin PrlF